jgi:hypothetical protein
MSFERIDRLVTKHGFYFQAWNDRYSKGVWASLGLWEGHTDTVRDLSSAGDLDMIPAIDYVLSADWLPYVTGRTLAEAMEMLEERLACLPQDQLDRGSQWSVLVSNAIDALRDATRNRTHYATEASERPHVLGPLPETFALASAHNVSSSELPDGGTR